jgi:hypothetical protein
MLALTIGAGGGRRNVLGVRRQVAVADHRRHRDDAAGALVLDVRERRVHLAAGR